MLDAKTMAADIDAAITAKANNPIFQAKTAAGADVSKEIWEAICAQIIKHIKNDMEITITPLTIEQGQEVGNWETSPAGVPVPVVIGSTLREMTTTTKTIKNAVK